MSDCSDSAIDIQSYEVAIAFGLVVLLCIFSLVMKLNFAWDLLVAAIRVIAQLALLGFVLEPVFTYEQLWAVMLVTVAMASLGAREAYATTSYHYGTKMFWHCWLSIIIATTISTIFAVLLVVKITPWYRPQYVIPMVGMLLGNSLKGIQLALDSAMNNYVKNKDEVEAYLARGATIREASLPVVVEAMRQGLLPTINQMSIIGLVSIPGMMTGQIIGGTPPLLAAKYQMIIMFLITASSALSIVIVMLLIQSFIFDEDGRLVTQDLKKRTQKAPDIVIYTGKLLLSFGNHALERCKQMCQPISSHENQNYIRLGEEKSIQE